MAPKKRARTSQNSKTTGAPDNIADVAPVRLELRDWVTTVYQGRHGFSESRKWSTRAARSLTLCRGAGRTQIPS